MSERKSVTVRLVVAALSLFLAVAAGVDASAQGVVEGTSGGRKVELWGGANADPHAAVFQEDNYPSAVACAPCHPKVFWEWAASNHAYASISPMFHKFEQAVNDLTSGTMGSFCVRCHQQVGTQRGEPREQPLWERSNIAREGITCVTCHRAGAEYYKQNGERRVMPGKMSDPVLNSGAATKLNDVIADKDFFRVATKDGDPGQPIHMGAIKFDQIGKSEFCVSCHQVAVNLGIKLEVVWDQYRDSPANSKGITCQECHMGKIPGEPKGYEKWPIAIVNGRIVGDGNAKHSNHLFFGPGYPIAHPGLFPFNQRALRWSIQDWLQFNYRAPWGEVEWEEKIRLGQEKSPDFPAPWKNADDRIAARYVIDQNLLLLEDKRISRVQVMENGSKVDGPFFGSPPKAGQSLKVRYRITNIDEGHNLPSGSLGAQPEIWFNVALTGPDGKVVWETGYVDKYGDMADNHSLEVAAGTIKLDYQLVNLQTKFLTTNVKGTDREMYLPVNFDVDQLPMLRPAGQPTTVLNHPPGARMEGRSIPPLGYRDAKYTIPAEALSKPGKYRLSSRLRSRAEPIYFMKFVGATADMERAINEWMIDIHPYAVEFEVK
jgi:hypothetical protein